MSLIMKSRSSWQISKLTQTTLSSRSRLLINSACKRKNTLQMVFANKASDPNILKGVDKMNFRKPSKVQEKTLPLLLLNPPTNLIGQSQSGTGKTAAFVLNILSRIDLSSDQARRTPQALVLAPSRELARQIQGVIRLMGAFLEGLSVEAAVPVDVSQRARKIESAVVVGTPGTVMDMIRKRSMDARGFKVLVLDEADNMLDQQGLGDQCTRVKT